MSEEGETFEALAKKNRERIAAINDHQHKRRTELVELQIRSAIDRFVTGTTKATGDDWTAVRLVEESGIPRPTLYRYKEELALFQRLAALAPLGSGGLREENRRLRAELREEKQRRIEDSKQSKHIQDVLVQRVHALSLALAQVTGQSKVVSLLGTKISE